MYDYHNKENNVPYLYKVLDKFLMFFPACNSLFGIIFYSLLVYLLKVLIKVFCSKPFDANDDNDQFNNNNLANDKQFKERLEAARKIKAKEAEDLLKKLN